mgnify:CR=1 FL=1
MSVDYNKLTDDELTDRISKARKYLNQMIGSPHFQLVESLRMELFNLEDEQQRRIAERIKESSSKEMMAKGIDPDAPIVLGSIDGIDPKPLERIMKKEQAVCQTYRKYSNFQKKEKLSFPIRHFVSGSCKTNGNISPVP